MKILLKYKERILWGISILLVAGLAFSFFLPKNKGLEGSWLDVNDGHYRLLIGEETAYFQKGLTFTKSGDQVVAYRDQLLLTVDEKKEKMTVKDWLGKERQYAESVSDDISSMQAVVKAYQIRYELKGDRLILHLDYRAGNDLAKKEEISLEVEDFDDKKVEQQTIEFKRVKEGRLQE